MEAKPVLLIAAMKASTVLFIAVPILCVLAVALIVATNISRQRSATGSLTKEARKADRSGSGAAIATTDQSEEARARSSETKQSLGLVCVLGESRAIQTLCPLGFPLFC